MDTSDCVDLPWPTNTVRLENPVPEATLELIARARSHDPSALEALYRRFAPRLRQWAHARLPRFARALSDTQDLVREVLWRTIQNIDRLDVLHEGALQAHLREAVDDRIKVEIQRLPYEPEAHAPDGERSRERDSPLDAAVGRPNVQRYEQALHRLGPKDRELVIARLEMQSSYEELAEAFGYRSAELARAAATRAVYRLVQEIR